MLDRADDAPVAGQQLLSPSVVTVECSLTLLEDEYDAHDDQVTSSDEGVLALKYAQCITADGKLYDIEDSDLVEEEVASGHVYNLTLQPSRNTHGHLLFKVVAAVKAGGMQDAVAAVPAAGASNAVLATASSPASVSLSILSMRIEFLDTPSGAKSEAGLAEDLAHLSNLYCARRGLELGATLARAFCHRQHGRWRCYS